MLKDKYRFIMTHAESVELYTTLTKAIQIYGNTKDIELMLPIAVLADFQIRLHTKLLFPTSKIKLHLKRTEALAFQALYLSNIVKTTSETRKIAHSIDTTL